MAEYLAAEIIEEHGLTTPLVWIEHYPSTRGRSGEYSLVAFTSWELMEVAWGRMKASGRSAPLVATDLRGGRRLGSQMCEH
jgi:hypothetical protein